MTTPFSGAGAELLADELVDKSDAHAETTIIPQQNKASPSRIIFKFLLRSFA
jgi:hypothetical protein